MSSKPVRNAPSIQQVDTSSRTPTQCWCDWRTGVPCLATYTHVVEVLHAPGMSQMCLQHVTGFRKVGNLSDCRIWTRDVWEKEARARYAIRARAAGLTVPWVDPPAELPPS